MSALGVAERQRTVDEPRPSLLSPVLIAAAVAALVALVWALTWTLVL